MILRVTVSNKDNTIRIIFMSKKIFDFLRDLTAEGLARFLRKRARPSAVGSDASPTGVAKA